MAARTPLSHDDYTVGWICALPLEMAAAKLMLDAIHPSLPLPSTDQNTYILGNIGEHNIVIACLPSGAYGTISAATVAMQLLSSFHSIRFGLMVGIGGGVPSSHADIRLGDIVVSRPADTSGGVIQYDLGKALSGGQFQRTGMLNRPPKILLTALATLRAHHLTEDSRILEFISNIQVKTPRRAANFARPSQEDCLYQADYEHGAANTCIDCDRSKLILRPSRGHEEPVIHYGLIASANQVVKDGRRRDQLAQDLGVYCVEMEAAGLMNDFPCLVIRGICDYADSHKNKEWQGYAAAVAAAYAKELLLVVPINQIDSTPTAREALAHTAPCFDVPLDLTAVPVIENFLGRQDELEHLWQYLQPKSSQSRKVAILHGLGGIRKTQLAIRFALDHKHEFTAIFWLSGKDRGTLLQSLSSILPRLPGQSQNNEAINDEEVEQRARRVLRWLAIKGNSRWLIIFDNINQYSHINSAGDAYDIGEFLPAADHGSILITSRLRKLTELGKSFTVNKLDSADAIKLLLQSSHISTSNPDILALASRLDGLPLAIVIAGAFMRETGISATDYLRYYQESWSNLLSQSNPERQYQQGNMLQTWMISYHEIQKRDPRAAELLLLLAHFDNRDIWYELIQSSRHSSNVPVWLEKTISSGLAFKSVVRTLIEFSLLESKEQDGGYAMHPVVQDWCIHLASTDKNVDSIQLDELALVSVGYTVPSSSVKNYSKLQQRLIPHANHVRHGEFSGNNIAVWGAFQGLGDLYSDQGKLQEAEEMYQRALAGYERALGPDHTSTLDTVNNLGILYRDQGKLKEAEEMFLRALTGSQKALGPDHTSTLMTINNIGSLYKDQGKLQEAKQMYQRALAGYEKTLHPDHTSTLVTVNNLGSLYRDQGKLNKAEEMYRRALVGYEKALGPDDTSTLDTVNNIGSLYKDQGKLKEAEEMFLRALTGSEKALGLDHTSTLMTVNNLGSLYKDQGKLNEAEEMYQRALAGYERALGPDHTSTLDTVNNLGILYRDQGKLKEAEEMYLRALAGYEKTLYPDHTSTLITVNNLGSLYKDQGKLQEAEKMYQRALAGYEKTLYPNYTSTLVTVNNLGSLYKDQGKLQEAEEMHQRARVLHNKQFPPGFRDFEDSGDSDVSLDNDSVFSAPISIPSTRSLESGGREINSLLIQEFATLLHENAILLSLISVGVSKQRIGLERMRNNFRRLLKDFANNLKAEIHSQLHRELRSFVSSYSDLITRKLFAMTPIAEKPNIKHSLASIKKRPFHERKVEEYLEKLHRGLLVSRSEESDNLSSVKGLHEGIEAFDLDEESDQDSVAEEAGEDEPYEGSLQHLDQMKHFVLESTAYQILLRRLEEFVQPSLYCRLRDLVAKWSCPESENHDDVARYKLRNLVTDLQHVDPHEIQFDCDQDSSPFAKFISHYQHTIERWTGERWDWWPLPRCLRPLGESETRLRWRCVCGEERWAEVPNAFVRRLQSIINNLPIGTTAKKNIRPPPATYTSSNSTSRSAPNNSQIPTQLSHPDHGSQQPGESSSNPSHHQHSGLKANNFHMNISQHRVLFLAKQGQDYRLAQIRVGNMNSHDFFNTLKEEYFRLRGVLRVRFSVWRFSHCDFYKFEKFDDHEFTPKKRDAFPDHANADYEYQPRPMENIPPISEHEFTKRFYACHNPRPLLHLHHKCKRLGAHSDDILKFLPKKRTELEEAGDKREDFWGIYAREIISQRWIMFYNFVCVLPLLAFFVIWIIPHGHGTDLQNPPIPISIMLSMLSLFWSIFLSSLQFGNSH